MMKITTKMNAFNLYEAVYDSARSEYFEGIPCAKDVMEYAEGAFNLVLEPETVEKIVAARLYARSDECLTSNDFWHGVEKPLSEIDL